MKQHPRMNGFLRMYKLLRRKGYPRDLAAANASWLDT